MISNKHQLPQSLLQQSSAYEQLLLQRYSQQPFVSNDDLLYLYQVRMYRASKDYEFIDLVKKHSPMDMIHQDLIAAHYYTEKPKLGLYPRLDLLHTFHFKKGNLDIDIIYPGLSDWYVETTSEYDLEEDMPPLAEAWTKMEERLDEHWDYHVVKGHHSCGHDNRPSFVKNVYRWADEDGGFQTFQPKADE